MKKLLGAFLVIIMMLSLFSTVSFAENTEEEEATTLPDLIENEKLIFKGEKSEQHFTAPPARYTEASLVKALEDKNIGRPSTYAPIVATITDRKYVKKENGKKYVSYYRSGLKVDSGNQSYWIEFDIKNGIYKLFGKSI